VIDQPPLIGKLILELRGNTDVAAITDRVRFPEPAPGDAAWSDNPTTHVRTYEHPFIVLVLLTSPPLPGFRKVPVAAARLALRCYGRTSTEAEQLYLAARAAVHGVGPRTYDSGLAIWQSFDDTGGGVETDPDTRQPHFDFVLETLVATQAVT
jgi:hypothetical protein